ncbi:ABC transporter ATP-binding protein [Jeongeupia chitinilytica]|uniref:ABC transporter n=1 Tax=Jeongeupia chitinilytica TaxID=1041641 RepID=A0ABQ3GV60_9NEIS|nr:ATP-binding cassette domain-containing protein [Jeongeupia chitinilytica]GHD56595.1 ABC transporter [Jeongeupia chitinilytica]
MDRQAGTVAVEPIISVRTLRKTYTTFERGSTFAETLKSVFWRKTREVDAVRGISFAIGAGEIVGFLGPNGAGKSTTLKMLTGVLYPSDGEATVLGMTPWHDRKRYVAHIGAVFGQKSQLMWDIPPLDAFHMNRAIYRLDPARFEHTLQTLVTLLDVGDQVRKPTRQLSLGERMKCEFIMAMLHEPKVVFLDEPTIGLDVFAKERIRGFIREMNARGTTFILTTHDLDDIEQLARRVIVINHGCVVFDGDMAALQHGVGQTKRIRLATARPPGEIDLPGVTLLERIGETRVLLELDVRRQPLPAFVRWADDAFGIHDLVIEDVPIEDIIKTLYA